MEKENYTNIYTSILDYWNNISNLEFVVTLFLIFLISFIFWYKITKCARISFYYKETTRNNAIIKQSKLFTVKEILLTILNNQHSNYFLVCFLIFNMGQQFTNIQIYGFRSVLSLHFIYAMDIYRL